ncbi:MAG: alpha-2-macroglobulin family protein [Hyphomonadaceae bacterium]|nr:alpha-2-macroglobulin family protein [Hyphomonadaceae bacterium]
MNRNVIVAAAAALAVGLLGGVVLGQTGSGPRGWFQGAGGGPESVRSAKAPRAGIVAPGDMAFDRLRIETGGDTPVACLEFTQTLANDPQTNYADFVVLSPAAQVRFEPVDKSLCLRGLPYDVDRQVTIREGLPGANGKKTRKDETFNLTFGDRPSFVGFAGSGVILPRAEADGVGIETVNVSKLKVEVLRVSDRILSQRAIEEGEAVAEGSWNYWSIEEAGSDFGVSIWKGEIDVAKPVAGGRGAMALPEAQRNRTMTTVFPLGAVLKDRTAGVYVLRVIDGTPSAGARGENNDRPAAATRWIMYTDMALQSFSGATGMDVVVRSLKDARPMSGVTLTLIAQNNDELARARTNGEGRARFAQALMKGEGPQRARYVMAYGAGGDFAALDLERGTLDLSERDVGGRSAPGDVDAYMFTERGIYRPGEIVRVNGMLRDPSGRAISNRQSTLVIYRPNGTEFRRLRLEEARAAGSVIKNIQIDRNAPRGQWRAVLEVDGQDQPAGDVAFAVEDFVPQRLRVKVEGSEAPLTAGQTRAIAVDAQFLYGAPGAGLVVQGEGRLQVDPNPFPALAGYAWGKPDERFDEEFFQLPDAVTDGAGRAELQVALPNAPQTSMPLRAKVIASVAEPGGRVVRQSFDIPVRLAAQYIGVKAKGDGWIRAGQPAAFDVVAVDPQARRVASRVTWRIVEEDWSYDWYLEGGQWKWRRTGRDIQVAGAQGTADIPAGEALTLTQANLREGSYRLILKNEATGAEATRRFGVGWGGYASDADTPDMVAVLPPSAPVRPGGRVEVEIKPPYAGEAQIVVATDRVLSMRTERIPAEGKKISLRVDGDWGAGAYVLVTVMTPRDPAGRRDTPVVPRRAVGVSYVPVDMTSRTLTVTVADKMGVVRPRQRVEFPITVAGAPRGEKVRVTLAAVDEGILQLTNYRTPDPKNHYFGRRALGVGIRDDYGRLLNPNLGAPATPRQGGDSLGGEGLTVVPTRTVALWSGLVELDRNGNGKIPLDVPDFNGELRVMAVAWSETALGSDDQAVTVRDPVVADLTLPRFLAPGDEAFATLRIDNIEGASGAYRVTLGGEGAARAQGQPQSVSVNRGGNATIRIPVTAPAAGIGKLTLNVSGPENFVVTRDFDIEARAPYLPITQVALASQARGDTFSLMRTTLNGFQPNQSKAIVSYSSLAGLDPAPLLDSLERYPYGCTEQLVSVAMPLLYANTLAPLAARDRDRQLTPRLNDAITKILDRQTPDGAFGLWRAGDGAANPWLGAYTVDFLRRAKEAGYVVPAAPLEEAYKGLRAVARLDDFANVAYDFNVPRWTGQTDTEALLRSRATAYALYVLAKAGKADVGQVRYFHDARMAREPSPLARAQIGAALAHLGDRARARSAFRQAEAAIGYRNTGDYYQSVVRDTAGVIALAAEAAATDPSLNEVVVRLSRRLQNDQPRADQLMTQEQSQLLLAANALLKTAGPVNISVNGNAPGAMTPFTAVMSQLQNPITFRNDGTGPVWRSVTLSGAPTTAPPATSNGLSVTKRVFSLSGALVDLNAVRQGDRVIVALTGAPEGQRLYPSVLVDLLPAGLEIESILGPADGAGIEQWDGRRVDGPFAWLGRISYTRIAEKRDDRFVAALDVQGQGYTVAYVARAVTPGTYVLPGAAIEDMYKPGVYGRSATSRVRVAAR